MSYSRHLGFAVIYRMQFVIKIKVVVGMETSTFPMEKLFSMNMSILKISFSLVWFITRNQKVENQDKKGREIGDGVDPRRVWDGREEGGTNVKDEKENVTFLLRVKKYDTGKLDSSYEVLCIKLH